MFRFFMFSGVGMNEKRQRRVSPVDVCSKPLKEDLKQTSPPVSAINAVAKLSHYSTVFGAVNGCRPGLMKTLENNMEM
jgi:hypothetical protein